MSCAVIVIDVQEGLFATEPAPADAAATLARINALTARARAAGVPVALVQHQSKSGDLAADAPGHALYRDLEVAPGDARIRKTTPDAFQQTELADWLAERGVTQLIVCGYASEFCVDTTVRRAAALGYPVTLAADAHTTHDKPHATGAQIRAHHNATLSSITSFGPRIVALPAADIVLGAPAAA
ncbi:cysteine hydrolase family protein [Bordetella genomosp. 1]|uniref:Cysteine hydrolase n=1 Tax=Bordetella genomosp. 1 TaxID=1395607 RepID=A0ABX4F5Y2_9BORD|nr:cysteine hydrolase family protein [Bordetella genomosp. 1]OZI68731.1 cysteine hydrolase [Bordetella genomosp. 1]